MLEAVDRVEGFTESVFYILNNWCEVDKGKFAMVLFNIWRQRNGKIWDDTLLSEEQVVHAAGIMLCDWLSAQNEKRSNFGNLSVPPARAACWSSP